MSAPDLAPFQQVQRQFAAHIRNPDQVLPPDGVEDRRMAIYRGLFYRNIEGFIRGAFPVLYAITPEAAWGAMIRDFMVHYRCETPYFLEISQEFIRYLEEQRGEQPDDPPFLGELAHYEWVELALDVSEDEPDWQVIDGDGDLLTGCPVLSPQAWSLSYDYPVHRIGSRFQPRSAPPERTFLLVYRDSEDEVKFMETNAVTARLLEIIASDEQLTGRAALLQLAQEVHHAQPEQLLNFGQEYLLQLRQRGVVLGARRVS